MTLKIRELTIKAEIIQTDSRSQISSEQGNPSDNSTDSKTDQVSEVKKTFTKEFYEDRKSKKNER